MVGCLAYTIAYQLSFGPGIFVVGSEIFPARIRGRLLGAQTFFGSMCLAVTSELFPALVSRIGLEGTFTCHLVCCAACLAFLHLYLVETKASSAETTRRKLEARLFTDGPSLKCGALAPDAKVMTVVASVFGGRGRRRRDSRRAFDLCPDLDSSESVDDLGFDELESGHEVQMV